MPRDIDFRPPRPEDADAVAAVLNACAVAEIGVADTDAQEIRSSWDRPGRDAAADFIVAEMAGRIVGYLQVDAREPWTSFPLDGYVHPEAIGQGVGSGLLERGVARVREAARRAAAGEQVVAFHGVWHGAPGAALLAAHGFSPCRVFWRMRVEMASPPPSPARPEGLTIRTVHPGEEQAVHAASEEAFADHWEHRPSSFERWFHYYRTHRGYDPSLWFVGVDGDQIAGVALCRRFDAEEPDAASVEDVSVRRPWRHRGLALALLLHAFGELYRRGITKAALDVDAESTTGAPRLYERAGMSVQRRINVYGKVLVEGLSVTPGA